MKMHCPHCGVKGSADDVYIGRKIRCPKCQEAFRCQADEEASPGFASQEPIPPLTQESPSPSPVDESSATETPMAEIDEPSEVLPEEEQPSCLEDSSPVAPQDLAQSEEHQEEEIYEEESADAALDVPPFPDLEQNQGLDDEELEALLAGEPEAEPVEEALGELGEELAVPAVIAQEPSAASREAAPENQDEQEPHQLDKDVPSPALEPVPQASSLPAAATAVDEQPSQTAKEPSSAFGGFAQGVAPRADFTLGEALNEAWQYTRGAKGSIWAAMGMMYLVMLILGLGLGFMQGVFGVDPTSAAGIWAEIGVQSLVSAISTLFTAGLMYIGVRRAAEKNYSWKMVFAGFPLAMKVLIAGILMTLLVISGLVLFILPGIYLAVGYTMTLPLMLDRQLEPWQAMETSRKAIHKVWWKVSTLFFVMGLIYLVSAIPLGIGLIWTVPMFVVLGGVVYRYLFGVQSKKH